LPGAIVSNADTVPDAVPDESSASATAVNTLTKDSAGTGATSDEVEILKALAEDETEEVKRTSKDVPIIGATNDGKDTENEVRDGSEEAVTEYKIEAILESRRKGRGFQYLVKWDGYDHSHNSWYEHKGQMVSPHYLSHAICLTLSSI
jgi:hypothetical protein